MGSRGIVVAAMAAAIASGCASGQRQTCLVICTEGSGGCLAAAGRAAP